ncbi:MAG TPA: hypothetical protein VM711_05585 [Sphingomicrobium sp.]|nr:hypothetical protein [Sphingomicrobium sp.]
MPAVIEEVETVRPIIHRTFGQRHGAISRLVSPHRVGELIKPFVFLDLFDTRAASSAVLGSAPIRGSRHSRMSPKEA